MSDRKAAAVLALLAILVVLGLALLLSGCCPAADLRAAAVDVDAAWRVYRAHAVPLMDDRADQVSAAALAVDAGLQAQAVAEGCDLAAAERLRQAWQNFRLNVVPSPALNPEDAEEWAGLGRDLDESFELILEANR